ncbi:MAG: fatty acid--CoA ligase family protein [Acidimicrobiales bacterium]
MPRLIALCLPGGPAFVEQLRRAWDSGDAVLPVDLRLAPPARERLLSALRPACWVGPDGIATPLAGAEPVEGGDALVMATSGSTGEPKGVVLTHEAVEASARATSRRLAVDAGTDAWWACLPLSHVGGLSVVTRSLTEGVRCDVVEGFSEEGALAALKGGATLTSLVPTALWRLPSAVADRFRHIVLGGQAPPAVLPPNVVTTYGLTETGSGLVYDGRPIDGAELRIVGGEIHVRGPMLLRCYRDGRDPKDGEGWFATGDGGEMRPDGSLSVLGRMSEMIISGGENIWPAAVEAVIARHPAVADVAVGGVPDPEWGERVVAYVVLEEKGSREGPLLGQLRALVMSEIAGYAAPREVVLVEAIERTALGKVQRERLGASEGESPRRPTPSGPTSRGPTPR